MVPPRIKPRRSFVVRAWSVAGACAVAAAMLTHAPHAAAATESWQFAPAIMVSTPGEGGFDASLAVSADGLNQAVGWSEDNGGRNSAFASVSTDAGTTWDDSTALSASGQNAADAKVVMASDGQELAAVWVRFDGSNWITQGTGSSDAGSTWAAASNLSAAGTRTYAPSVAIAAASTQRVGLSRSLTTVQGSTASNAATWGSPAVDISSTTGRPQSPQVVMSADGSRAVAVWADTFAGAQSQVALSTDSGATWSRTSIPGDTGPVEVAMSADGVHVVTAYVNEVGGNREIRVRTSDDSATTWNTAIVVSAQTTAISGPSVAMSADGSGQSVTWSELADGQYSTLNSVSSDFGQTWSTPQNVSGASSANNQEPAMVMSADGRQQAMEWVDWPGAVTKTSASFDAGISWSAPRVLESTSSGNTAPTLAMSADGSSLVVAWRLVGVGVMVQTAVVGLIPDPPAPPVPATAPRDVSGVAGTGLVNVSWSAPVSSGSFPVTTYQARSQSTLSYSNGQTCLVAAPDTSCVIDGLAAGESYVFQVRALTGAGWSSWSAVSSPVVVPVVESMVITGARDGRFVVVNGATTGLVGVGVTPRVRFPGPDGYSSGVGVRTVSEDGAFSWQRRTAKKVYVYFRAGDGVRSNRVIINAR